MKNYLKFFVLCGALLLASPPARADGRSRAMLDALAAKLSGEPFEVLFTASMPGEFDDIDGRIVVSGDRYYLNVYRSEVFFDGKTQQTYNAGDNELILESPDPADNFILASPSRFFRFAESDFRHEYRGSRVVEGKTVDEIVLTPVDPNAGYTSITLQIDPVGGMPVSVVSVMEGVSAPVGIRIRKITPGVAADASLFTFDKSRHKGVEVIDFR